MTSREACRDSAKLLCLVGLLHVVVLVSSTAITNYGVCRYYSEMTCPSPSDIKFALYTRLTPNGQTLDFLDHNTFSTFRGGNPTKIIIHGFVYSNYAQSVLDMTAAYLQEGDYNVVAVDWSRMSQGPEICYPTATLNAAEAGKCVGYLVHILRAREKNEDIHVIGMGLGTRVASQAGNSLQPYYLLPRITGLDPYRVIFGYNDYDSKLDRTDAFFVDVIHTSYVFRGEKEQSGHVDFYANGGMKQPGCETKIRGTGEGIFMCSHKRAMDLFTESIISARGFWGWECKSLLKLAKGLCYPQSPAILMGEHVSHKARGVVHVSTRAVSPFSLGPWVVSEDSKFGTSHSHTHGDFDELS